MVLERVATPHVKIGIFGIGLHAYWDQFPGLKERLEGYQRDVEQRLRALGADVISAGLVDTAPAAREAGVQFTREDVDLVVCYVGTYATSSQVVPAVQGVNRPVLVLNLQPTPALDYERTDTGEWLANCCVCCVPELAGAFTRCGIPLQRRQWPIARGGRTGWRSGLAGDWRLGGRRGRGTGTPHWSPRLPRPHLPRHARPLR